MNNHDFGGSAETVAVLSPHHVVPNHVQCKRSALVSLKDTEDYHLFMAMKEAAKMPTQIQDMQLLITQATNRYLAENRSHAMKEGGTSFLGEDASHGHRQGKRHKHLHERWMK